MEDLPALRFRLPEWVRQLLKQFRKYDVLVLRVAQLVPQKRDWSAEGAFEAEHWGWEGRVTRRTFGER